MNGFRQSCNQFSYEKYSALAMPLVFSEKKMLVFSFRKYSLSRTALRTCFALYVPIRNAKGDYRFKAVNLHAALVGQSDGVPYLTLIQNAVLAERLYPCPDSRGGYIEQLAKLPLTHGGCLYIFRQVTTLPNSFIVMMFLSSFIIV